MTTASRRSYIDVRSQAVQAYCLGFSVMRKVVRSRRSNRVACVVKAAGNEDMLTIFGLTMSSTVMSSSGLLCTY